MMFAFRTVFVVKRGCMRKALELVSAELDRAKAVESGAVRVYTPRISPNVLVYEQDWESIEVYDNFWSTYWNSPEGQAFGAQWDELIERSTGTELWNVKEWQ